MSIRDQIKLQLLTLANGMPSCMACRYGRFLMMGFAVGFALGFSAMGIAVWALWGRL